MDADANAATPPPVWRTIFLGPNGLRAGWRLALYLGLTLLLQVPAGFAARRWDWMGREGEPWVPAVLLRLEAVFIAIALIAISVMARIERRRFADYYIPWRRIFGVRFWEGAAWGVLTILAAALPVWAMGGYAVDGLAVRGAEALQYLLLWAVAFLMAGIYEEVAVRGYMQRTLADGIGYWPAAVLLSALFGFVLHFLEKENETWVDGLSVSLIALFFCWTVRRTGDIWLASGWHFSFNFVSMGILGSPNTGSGGGQPVVGHLLASRFTGPQYLTGWPMGLEASLWIFPALALTWGLLTWRLRGRA